MNILLLWAALAWADTNSPTCADSLIIEAAHRFQKSSTPAPEHDQLAELVTFTTRPDLAFALNPRRLTYRQFVQSHLLHSTLPDLRKGLTRRLSSRDRFFAAKVNPVEFKEFLASGLLPLPRHMVRRVKNEIQKGRTVGSDRHVTLVFNSGAYGMTSEQLPNWFLEAVVVRGEHLDLVREEVRRYDWPADLVYTSWGLKDVVGRQLKRPLVIAAPINVLETFSLQTPYSQIEVDRVNWLSVLVDAIAPDPELEYHRPSFWLPFAKSEFYIKDYQGRELTGRIEQILTYEGFKQFGPRMVLRDRYGYAHVVDYGDIRSLHLIKYIPNGPDPARIPISRLDLLEKVDDWDETYFDPHGPRAIYILEAPSKDDLDGDH